MRQVITTGGYGLDDGTKVKVVAAMKRKMKRQRGEKENRRRKRMASGLRIKLTDVGNVYFRASRDGCAAQRSGA